MKSNIASDNLKAELDSFEMIVSVASAASNGSPTIEDLSNEIYNHAARVNMVIENFKRGFFDLRDKLEQSSSLDYELYELVNDQFDSLLEAVESIHDNISKTKELVKSANITGNTKVLNHNAAENTYAFLHMLKSQEEDFVVSLYNKVPAEQVLENSSYG